ncbi:hypothetical protein BZK31_28295 [Pseudomonas floridensis]|uniref:Uncharacterized protein n=1 Tax=Pseudomonas floridensis TaxID=1958950 RepID=A0A1X0MLM3_9PSED|nr:hypothetical protein BZK31_28295 [Pseudomonas floridensis]
MGAVDLAVQVVAFHVADQPAVEVQLMQVAAPVVQVGQVLVGRQGPPAYLNLEERRIKTDVCSQPMYNEL